MNQGKYVFSQVMDLVVRYQFERCVKRYHGDHWVKQLTCYDQFLALAFGQLSFRQSLRDITVCLEAHREKLYHMGFRSPIRRSTLAEANEHRDWRIYRDFVAYLITETRAMYAYDALPTLAIDAPIYAIDSTTIELCFSLFPWAQIPGHQAAIKLHLGIELRGNIPSFFALAGGISSDVVFLDSVEFECGSYYVFDRGYYDFKRFYDIHLAGAFFITRAKKIWSFRRLYSNAVDKDAGIRCDQVGVLRKQHYPTKYPEKLRRIKYYDIETNHSYVFITNNFELPASVIAELYKQRWQVELFFKWLKQHLSVRTFWSRSGNAVKTQICVALATYLLVSMVKKKLHIERNTYEILQILSVSPFNRIPLIKLISDAKVQKSLIPVEKQASFWAN